MGQGQGGWSLFLVGARESRELVLVKLGGCSLLPAGAGKMNVIFI